MKDNERKKKINKKKSRASTEEKKERKAQVQSTKATVTLMRGCSGQVPLKNGVKN